MKNVRNAPNLRKADFAFRRFCVVHIFHWWSSFIISVVSPILHKGPSIKDVRSKGGGRLKWTTSDGGVGHQPDVQKNLFWPKNTFFGQKSIFLCFGRQYWSPRHPYCWAHKISEMCTSNYTWIDLCYDIFNTLHLRRLMKSE